MIKLEDKKILAKVLPKRLMTFLAPIFDQESLWIEVHGQVCWLKGENVLRRFSDKQSLRIYQKYIKLERKEKIKRLLKFKDL